MTNKTTLMMEQEHFGVRPSYLTDGLNAWLKACDMQASHGIEGLKRYGVKYNSFTHGIAKILHQIPKDIGALECVIEDLTGKKEIICPKERHILGFHNPKATHFFMTYIPRESEKTVNNYVHPLFDKMLAEGKDKDIELAGESFAVGNACDENLKLLTRLNIPPQEIHLYFRTTDFSLHRRYYSDEEFTQLCHARTAARELSEFYRNDSDFDEFRFSDKSEWPLELVEKYEKIKANDESAKTNWWNEFIKSINGDQLK